MHRAWRGIARHALAHDASVERAARKWMESLGVGIRRVEEKHLAARCEAFTASLTACKKQKERLRPHCQQPGGGVSSKGPTVMS